MNVYIAVAIGGAIGAMTRYGIGQYMVTKGASLGNGASKYHRVHVYWLGHGIY